MYKYLTLIIVSMREASGLNCYADALGSFPSKQIPAPGSSGILNGDDITVLCHMLLMTSVWSSHLLTNSVPWWGLKW